MLCLPGGDQSPVCQFWTWSSEAGYVYLLPIYKRKESPACEKCLFLCKSINQMCYFASLQKTVNQVSYFDTKQWISLWLLPLFACSRLLVRYRSMFPPACLFAVLFPYANCHQEMGCSDSLKVFSCDLFRCSSYPGSEGFGDFLQKNASIYKAKSSKMEFLYC